MVKPQTTSKTNADAPLQPQPKELQEPRCYNDFEETKIARDRCTTGHGEVTTTLDLAAGRPDTSPRQLQPSKYHGGSVRLGGQPVGLQ
jgi:hypothetical protein